MATISGLPAPNPYAQPAPRIKPAASTRSADADAGLPERAALENASAFTPDWMQAGPASSASGLYGAKGELRKLPEPATPPQEAAVVRDKVDLSSGSSVRYAVFPGSGKPAK